MQPLLNAPTNELQPVAVKPVTFVEFNPKPSACFLPSTIVSDVGSVSEDNRTDQELQDHSKRGREGHSAAEHSVNKMRKHNPKEVGKNVMAKEMMYKRRARN